MDVVPERPSLNSKVEVYREAIAQLGAEIDRTRDEKTQSDLPGRLLAALTARDEVKIALEDHTSDERKLLPIIVTLDEELRVLAKLAQQQGHFDISRWHDLISKSEPLDEWWQLGDSITPLFNRYSVSIDKLSAMVVTKGGNIRHLLSAALNDRNELKTVLAANPADAQSWRSRTAALDERLYSEGLEVLRCRFIEVSSWLALMSAHSPLDPWWHLDDPTKPTLDVYCLAICSLSDAVERSDTGDVIEWPELLINTLMVRDALKAALVAYPAAAPSKVPKITELDSRLRDLSVEAQRRGKFDISRWNNLLSENPALDEWWHFRDSVMPAFNAYRFAKVKLSTAVNAALAERLIPQEKNILTVLIKRFVGLILRLVTAILSPFKYTVKKLMIWSQRWLGIYETPNAGDKLAPCSTPRSELPQLLAEALLARDSLRTALTSNPSYTDLWKTRVNIYDKQLYANALNVLSLGVMEMSSWLKLVTAASSLEAWPHLDDPLTPTIDALRVSIHSLSHTLSNSHLINGANFPKLLIDILTARDALKASLITYPAAATPRLPEIMELDDQLYLYGVKALRSGKFDLSSSRSLLPEDVLNPWWHLDDPTVTGRGDRSFLFKILGVILFSISFAIITIKTQWFWDIGAEILGSVTAVAQIILGGALATKSGRELALHVFRALPVPWPRRLNGEAVLAAGTVFLAFTILIYAVGIPLIARYFHDQGQLAIHARDLTRARSLLEAAVKIEPNYATSLTQLGILYRQIGDDELALVTLERAIASDSRLIIAHNALADLYLDKAVEDKENAQYDKALRLLNHGIRIIRIGDALDEIMPLENQKEIEFQMLLSRARILIEQGEANAARIDLDQALDLKSGQFSDRFGPGNKVHTIELDVLYANAYHQLYTESCNGFWWNESLAYWEIVKNSQPDKENSIQERRWYIEAEYWLENPAPPCSIEEN